MNQSTTNVIGLISVLWIQLTVPEGVFWFVLGFMLSGVVNCFYPVHGRAEKKNVSRGD